MSVVKVWPLVFGLKGQDAAGAEIDLVPGQARWMQEEAAHEAAEAGKVQLMCGLQTTELKTADMSAEDPKQEPQATPAKPASKATPKKRTYKRKDMAAE